MESHHSADEAPLLLAVPGLLVGGKKTVEEIEAAIMCGRVENRAEHLRRNPAVVLKPFVREAPRLFRQILVAAVGGHGAHQRRAEQAHVVRLAGAGHPAKLARAGCRTPRTAARSTPVRTRRAGWPAT